MPGFSGKKLMVAAALAGAGAIFGSTHSASALSTSITSGDSTISVDQTTGQVSWLVNGVNEFGGSPTGGDVLSYYNGTDFVPIIGLNLVSDSVSKNIASATFSGTLDGDNFTISLKGILTGGAKGSGTAAVAETITVNNLGPAGDNGVNAVPVDFIIQDAFNANLNATANNDTLTFSPAGGVNTATQTDPTGVKLTYVTTPGPTGVDGSPASGASTSPATGDEQWVFDWDLSLAPGDTGIISNSISISGQGSGTVTSVPLPNSAAAAIVMLGGLGAVGMVRRRRSLI